MKPQTKIKLMNYSSIALVTIALLTPFAYDSVYSQLTKPNMTGIGKVIHVPDVDFALTGQTKPVELTAQQNEYLIRAQTYIVTHSTASKAEVIDELKAQQVPNSDITYIMDTLYAYFNWDTRAKNAAVYILESNTLPLTEDELFIQLTGEYGFTAHQAQYAISTIDYPAYLQMKRGQ